MKHILSIVALLIFLGCKSKIVETSPQNIKETSTMSDAKGSAVNFITSKFLDLASCRKETLLFCIYRDICL